VEVYFTDNKTGKEKKVTKKRIKHAKF